MTSRSQTAEAGRTEAPMQRSWPEDWAVAQRCAAGDAAAVEELYRAHATSVRSMARLHASQPAVIDDLVHDTFVRAIELLPRYRGDSPLGVWLRGIAFNLARTERRRSLRRFGLLRRHGLPPSHAPAAPDERSPLETVTRLVARLSEADREAFCLRSLQQLSLDEASALLGVSGSTVSDRDRRAKQKLRAWLEEEEE
ncbi:MAG: RNA polymerase sigma factor [Nannocystales bacterium]